MCILILPSAFQTGTLTQNVMTFLKCTIRGVKHGEVQDKNEYETVVATGEKIKETSFSVSQALAVRVGKTETPARLLGVAGKPLLILSSSGQKRWLLSPACYKGPKLL